MSDEQMEKVARREEKEARRKEKVSSERVRISYLIPHTWTLLDGQGWLSVVANRKFREENY